MTPTVPVMPTMGVNLGKAPPPGVTPPPAALRASPNIVLTPVSPAEPCTQMAFDPTDADRIAAVSGGVAHVTVDGGRTWTSVAVPADVVCPPSWPHWTYFTEQGDEPPCVATWGGHRLYLALDGAVESYKPDDPAGGWTALASQFSTGPCRCPENTAITSFSASAAGRWALVFATRAEGLNSRIETGNGASHHHLVRGWGGRVWVTPNGYALWGGRVTLVPMDVLETDSYRPYTSADGVTWTPVPTDASVDTALRQFVVVGRGVLYGSRPQQSWSEPPVLEVSRDGGQTWTGRTLWAPYLSFDQMWAGGGAVVLTACASCDTPPEARIHTDALYVSLDGGATWHTVVGLPATVPMSVNGHILRVAVSGRRIWVAIDYPPYWYTGALP